MGKRREAKEEKTQQKTNAKAASKQNNQKQKSQSQKYEPENILNLSHIKEQIKDKVGQVIQLKIRLKALGHDSTPVHDIHSEKLIQACENAASKQIENYVTKAQDQVHEIQRDIFTQVNALQSSYNKVRDILSDTKALNDIEIDQALNILTQKIQERKSEIQGLDRIVERGAAIIQKQK